MTDRNRHRILTILIAAVWLINGLLCKVLYLVPRHQDIVQTIIKTDRASAYYLTFLIGIAEIVMAIWVLTKYKSKFNAITQMTVVATMNILELILVPDLLLWGRLNSVFAILFIGLVYYNEFVLHKNLNLQTEK